MNLPKQLFHWFEQRQAALCHRQLLIITGQEQWTKNTADSLLVHNDVHSHLWVGSKPSESQCISIKDYRARLGHEYDWVVINCFSGFRANAVMALSGTIRAQGLMVLLCPELSQWPSYADPQQINRISFGYAHKNVSSFFIQHLISSFSENNAVAILAADKFSGQACYVVDSYGADGYVPNSLEKKRYHEQETAVASICKVAQGHTNRPLVLTADRGRGKSSALGLAAAKLMTQGAKTIWVTALHIDNTEQIFHHAQRMLPMTATTKNSVGYQQSILSFKAVDEILRSQENVNIVLVDEAASLPINILIKLLYKFPRIVFSSTVHGYEGSGRGFEMRFIKQLAQLKPGFKRIQMSQPIRWYQHDVLEQFWFNVFFHRVQQANNQIEAVTAAIVCCHITKAQLIDDKKLLASIFSLLIDAHYQTSQDDLQRLLDAPETECFIITQGNTLLGVAQIVEEGGPYLAELANHISDCTRRVKGHLVAQNIASTYNHTPFVLSRQWRISRIAITPDQQRKGLGKQLIDYVEQQAKQQHINYLSASFGCNTDILRFWYSKQFLLVKLGAKPEVSSGEHSAISIKSLTDEAQLMLESIHNAFHQEWLYQIDKNFQSLSADILIQILMLERNVNISAGENVKIIKQFATGKRAYSTCKRVLKEYLLVNPSCLTTLAAKKQSLLVAALLQNLTDKNLCTQFNLSGKKQIEQALKTSFSSILINQADSGSQSQ